MINQFLFLITQSYLENDASYYFFAYFFELSQLYSNSKVKCELVSTFHVQLPSCAVPAEASLHQLHQQCTSTLSLDAATVLCASDFSITLPFVGLCDGECRTIIEPIAKVTLSSKSHQMFHSTFGSGLCTSGVD